MSAEVPQSDGCPGSCSRSDPHGIDVPGDTGRLRRSGLRHRTALVRHLPDAQDGRYATLRALPTSSGESTEMTRRSYPASSSSVRITAGRPRYTATKSFLPPRFRHVPSAMRPGHPLPGARNPCSFENGCGSTSTVRTAVRGTLTSPWNAPSFSIGVSRTTTSSPCTSTLATPDSLPRRVAVRTHHFSASAKDLIEEIQHCPPGPLVGDLVVLVPRVATEELHSGPGEAVLDAAIEVHLPVHSAGAHLVLEDNSLLPG